MHDRTQHMLVGFGGGIAAAVLLPFLSPVLSAALRPLAKALIKQSMLGFDRLRTGVAKMSESVEDLLAEARSEVELELAAKQQAEADGHRAAPIGNEATVVLQKPVSNAGTVPRGAS